MFKEKLKFLLLKYLFLILQPFFKKDGYILVDNMYEKNTSCIDTYTIFKYLLNTKKNKNSFYLIWKNNLSYEKIMQEGVISFDIQGSPNSSDSYFLTKTFIPLLKCKYVISSFYGSLPSKYRQFLKKNKFINLVGVGHGPVLFKTLIFDYPFCKQEEWDKYLVTNDIEKQIFIENGWTENKLISCGLPRYDCCKEIKTNEKKIFIFFTWRLTFEKEINSIYSSKYLKRILEFVHNEELLNLLKSHEIKITMGLHHALIDIVNFNINDFNIPIEIADTSNLIKEINTSSLFITDYSSIFFDSAYLNHPCIFWRIDSDDKYLNETDKKDIENAMMQNHLIYNTFIDEKSVINCIKHYIENNFELEEEYKQKMEKFFYTKSNNTEIFINLLENK